MSERLGDGTMRRNERKYELQGGKWVVIPGKEKHPDYTGKVKIKTTDGEIVGYLSAWVRKGNDGTPFMSFAMEYQQNESRRIAIAGSAPTSSGDAFEGVTSDAVDEDLPF